MTDLQMIFRAVDTLTPEEQEALLQYLQDKSTQDTAALSKERVLGLHAHLGTAWTSDDFDEELPDEFKGEYIISILDA